MEVTVVRYDCQDDVEDGMEPVRDGFWVAYDSMQHFYKEALEHGLTLEQAIFEMESQNGR